MGDQQRCHLAVWVESGLVEIRRRQNANGVGAVICTKTGERGSPSRRGAHQTAPGPEGRSCSQVMESFACWLDKFEPHCTGSEELWIAFELRSSCSRLIWGQCGEGSGRNGMTVGAVRDWGSCVGGEDALVPVPRSALSTMAVMAVRRGSQR